MRNDLVTAVIPTYNYGRFVTQAVESALGQTYRNLDIIVVDDGSKDRTCEIVRAKTGGDSRIRLFTKSHAGVAAARNLGIAQARGDLIATLDADDLWHPAKIELQVRRLLQDSSAGVVYCWSTWIDVNDRIYWQPPSPPTFQGHVLAAAIFQNFVGNGSTPLMRRSCIEEVGGYDEEFRKRGAEGCEDYKLYVELAANTSFSLVPLFLVGYRIHNNSMSRDPLQVLRSHQIMLAEISRRWPHVPRRVYRWSKAGVAAHLALRAVACGDYGSALRLWGSAFCRDPELLLNACRRLVNSVQPTGDSARRLIFADAPVTSSAKAPRRVSESRRKFVEMIESKAARK